MRLGETGPRNRVIRDSIRKLGISWGTGRKAGRHGDDLGITREILPTGGREGVDHQLTADWTEGGPGRQLEDFGLGERAEFKCF